MQIIFCFVDGEDTLFGNKVAIKLYFVWKKYAKIFYWKLVKEH